MDADPQSSDIMRTFRTHWLPLSLGLLGLGLLGFGAFQLQTPAKEEEITFIPAQETGAQKTTGATIIVDVSGAVVKPGVYKLPGNSRMQDALIAAGGMSEQADRIAVAKQINLAASLPDAAKVYIPFLGDVASSATGDESGSININQATAAVLEDLPGIGEVTAEKIITNRPYQTIEDLMTKKVVSQKVFEQIKTRISAF